MKLHEAIESAIETVDEADLTVGREEVMEHLQSLLAMFRPYKGDPPEEARGREGAMGACCSNCGLKWCAVRLPGEVMRVGITMQRAAVCPRCFANEGIKVTSWP